MKYENYFFNILLPLYYTLRDFYIYLHVIFSRFYVFFSEIHIIYIKVSDE